MSPSPGLASPDRDRLQSPRPTITPPSPSPGPATTAVFRPRLHDLLLARSRCLNAGAEDFIVNPAPHARAASTSMPPSSVHHRYVPPHTSPIPKSKCLILLACIGIRLQLLCSRSIGTRCCPSPALKESRRAATLLRQESQARWAAAPILQESNGMCQDPFSKYHACRFCPCFQIRNKYISNCSVMERRNNFSFRARMHYWCETIMHIKCRLWTCRSLFIQLLL